MVFPTLAPRFRNEGAALFSLIRNIDAGIGISAMVALPAGSELQAGHAALAEYIHPFSLALRQAVEAGAHDLSAAGLQKLDAEVGRQATMLAYLQDFHLMMWVALLGIPLIALLRKPASPVPATESPALAEYGSGRQLASAAPILAFSLA
jgi:DHA2 family multidrug resistance protein